LDLFTKIPAKTMSGDRISKISKQASFYGKNNSKKNIGFQQSTPSFKELI
jgi:hypothetical protein